MLHTPICDYFGIKTSRSPSISLAPIPDTMRPHVPVMIEEKVKVFVAGLSVPQEFVKVMHDNGMKIVVMCGKVHHGVKLQDAGADVVVAQGTERAGIPAKSGCSRWCGK